ncbi:MAG: HAD-IA family hydrolase [Kofleriaceae bacterium]
MPAPVPARLPDLLPRYDGVLLDAYGVLVDAAGALPGAAALLATLEARAVPFLVVTNDASRSPATCAARFASLGLAIGAERILTSGELLADHPGLRSARTVVLGTDDSRAYVRAAGATLVELSPGVALDALAVCDDAGFPFLEGCELALSAVVRAVDAGRPPRLLLPNPDLVYPKGGGELGLTAGAIAHLIEAVLVRRFGAAAPRFEHLGKPTRHLFDRACARLGTRALLMVGDQLETDVAGARAAGLDAALVDGVSRWSPTHAADAGAPTYLLAGLD